MKSTPLGDITVAASQMLTRLVVTIQKEEDSLSFTLKKTVFPDSFLFLFCFIIGLQKQTKKNGPHKARFD